MPERTICYRSHLPVPASDVFAWHARDGAFERLTPPWMNVTVVSAHGGIGPGDGKQLRIKRGPFRFHWRIVHQPLESGLGFIDIQESGPFSGWRHEHLFDDDRVGGSWLEDRITYQLPFGALGDRLLGRRVERQLDQLFAFRHRQTRLDLDRHARYADRGQLRIAVSGATGLVGRRLVPFLRTGGHQVSRIVRTPTGSPDEIVWDPIHGTIDRASLEGFDAVIHLAGESIADGRWTADRKQRILASRVNGTTLLARTLASLRQPPATFVSTSAVGYYGDRGAERLTESSAAGDGFLSAVCTEWEAAANPARAAGIRVVHPRFGIVLAGDGGMLAKIAPLFRLGAGGRLANGQQYMSWIALDDLLGVLLEVVMNDELRGPVNAVAPESISNTAFTKALASAVHRPAIAPVPKLAIKAAFGEMAEELLLVSQRAEPARLTETGFSFAYPTIDEALRQELGAWPADIAPRVPEPGVSSAPKGFS